MKVEFTLCSNTDVDRYQYAYDRDGNRLYKYNKVLTSLSELYTYDTLNQIASYKLGTLNGSKTDVTGSPTTSQSWDYDAVGNWDSITTNSTTQTRTANKQNEITTVSGATTPTYDSNGNLTTDEANYRFVYDAWNRVIQVKNSSNVVIVTYGRDALHRHVTDTVGSTVTDRFFSGDWQVLETKVGSNTVTRNVWSPVYVDGLVLRDRDTDANGTLDERLYSLQDANWNTTALVNTGGTVQERYTYTPFGQVTFRDGSGSTLSGSAKDWVFLHQGGERIAAGNFEFRNRVYSPSLGRWLSNDPLGFEAGDQNWYRAIGNNPGNGLDPSGLDEWWFWSDPLYFVPVGEQNLVWDIWKTYINPKRSQRYLESKIRTISDGPLTIGHGLDQSFYNEVQQLGPVMLDKVAGDAAEKAAGAIVIGAAGVAARNIYKARKLVKPPSINPKTRLPRKNGKWSEGSPGNGLWESNIPEVNAITGGKPIPFKNGRPLFSEWSKGQIEFKPGTLNGSLSDFNYVYDHIAKKKGLPSRNAAVDYLKEVGLSPHHLDKNTIELIPTQLHKNIPHIGSASDLRGGY